MTPPPKPGLRVASYNIRKARGTDGRRDPARTLATIAGLQADIVTLQEADHRLGRRPAALPRASIAPATGLRPLDLGRHPVSLGWHGIALLVSDRIQVEDVETHDLPGYEPRGAVLADLATPLGPLRLIAVHLGLLRRARRLQLDHLREAMEQRDDRPTLMLGDFNEYSTKRGLGRIARTLSIAPAVPSFPSRWPRLPLDRMATTADLTLTPLALPDRPAHAHASDHLPILASLGHRSAA